MQEQTPVEKYDGEDERSAMRLLSRPSCAHPAIMHDPAHAQGRDVPIFLCIAFSFLTEPAMLKATLRINAHEVQRLLTCQDRQEWATVANLPPDAKVIELAIDRSRGQLVLTIETPDESPCSPRLRIHQFETNNTDGEEQLRGLSQMMNNPEFFHNLDAFAIERFLKGYAATIRKLVALESENATLSSLFANDYCHANPVVADAYRKGWRDAMACRLLKADSFYDLLRKCGV